MTETWLPIHGAGFEVRCGEWFSVANPGVAIVLPDGTRMAVKAPPVEPLGLRRLAYHQAEAASRDAMFAKMAIDKSTAARGALSIAEMVRLGPTGLNRRGINLLGEGEWLCRRGYRGVVDPDGYERLEGSGSRDYAEGSRLKRAGSTLCELAMEMADGWSAIEAKDDLAAAEIDRRRQAIKACGWDDCGCGAAFQPGERQYRRCFKCNQIESAEGRVRCAICSAPHSMKFGACFNCKNAGREEAAIWLRSVVTRRDHFVCQMCGTDEGQLQVDHIRPCALSGDARPWNLQALCTWCNILKGARFGPLDEMAKVELMNAYRTYLADFLDSDERKALAVEYEMVLCGEDRQNGGWHDMAVRPMARFAVPEDHGVCDEIEGMMTVLAVFGREGIEVSHL